MADALVHEALPYTGVNGFSTACSEVVRVGLQAEDRVIVLAGSEKLAAVTDALGPDAAEVTFVSLDAHGRNPSRITTMLDTFQAAADGRHCVGVNESVLAGRAPAVLAEAQLSEFLLNDPSLARWPMTLVCLYDLDTLSGPVLDSMRQSHAVIRGEDVNTLFVRDGGAALWSAPLGPVPPGARRMTVDADHLGRLRQLVRDEAVRAQLGVDGVDDLVLAANEIVTNSVRYGGGRAEVAVWRFDGGDGGVVCDVRDTGHLTDALIGRLTPALGSTSGRGMWLANQLCDLVQVRSSAAGTTVRLYLHP